MRHLTVLLAIVVIGFSACKNAEQSSPEPQKIADSKHSTAFNQSVQSAMGTYYDLTEAFVNWDSVAASSLAKQLSTKLDSLPLDEIKKDSTVAEKAVSYIDSAKKDLSGIVASSDITAKRHALNALTDNLFQFLNDIKYDREKLYLQECPMAFNDVEAGHWISVADSIRNPYLGLHHPRYGKGMLECGDNKEVLNFTGTK
jgi:hypothetical protein